MIKCLYNSVCPLNNTYECNNACPKYRAVKFLLDKSMIPEKRRVIQQFDVPNEDKSTYYTLGKVVKNIKEIVDNGTNIVLYSDRTGNGKTSWAIKLLLAYFDKIWADNGFRTRGYFIYVPEFLNRVKASINHPDEELQEIMDNIKDVDLLVLDDIGTTSLSEYDISLLSTIIDQRCLKEKSTIYTTNIDKYKMETVFGRRLTDRIWNNSTVLTFRGDSHRGLI